MMGDKIAMFNLYAFLAYIFVTAFTPGPNNIMSMGNASRYGLRKSFRFNLGILLGFSIVMILCTLLSAILFQVIPTIKPFTLIIGAAYILWLAFKTWNASDIKVSTGKDSNFLSGFLLQFVNPKIIIYGITAMSSYILPYFSAPSALIAFALILAFVGFVGTMLGSFRRCVL